MAMARIRKAACWTEEELSSPFADPTLNQETWERLPSEYKAQNSRDEWRRYGPGGYGRWERFVWVDGDIEIIAT